jgi:hypothetical protein
MLYRLLPKSRTWLIHQSPSCRYTFSMRWWSHAPVSRQCEGRKWYSQQLKGPYMRDSYGCRGIWDAEKDVKRVSMYGQSHGD